MEKNKDIIALIIHYNNPNSLNQTIQNIRSFQVEADKIYIHDNSDSETYRIETRWVCENHCVNYIKSKNNLGWGASINKFIRNYDGDGIILIAAHDALIESLDVFAAQAWFRNPDSAAYTPSNGTGMKPTYSHARFFYFVEEDSESKVSIGHATASIFRISCLREIHFDENFFIYGCESEIFLRLAERKWKALQDKSFRVVNPQTDSSSRLVKRAFTLNSIYCAKKHGGYAGMLARSTRIFLSSLYKRDAEKFFYLCEGIFSGAIGLARLDRLHDGDD